LQKSKNDGEGKLGIAIASRGLLHHYKPIWKPKKRIRQGSRTLEEEVKQVWKPTQVQFRTDLRNSSRDFALVGIPFSGQARKWNCVTVRVSPVFKFFK